MKRIYLGFADSRNASPEALTAAFGEKYTDSLRSDGSLIGASLLADMLAYAGVRTGRRTRVARTANGKPYFKHCSRISFSISHAAGAAVCALSFGGDVGIDLEFAGRRDAATERRLAGRWLTPRGFDTGGTPQSFAAAWTSFEASSKYSGGTLAECRGVPAGAVCDSFTVGEDSQGAVTVCHKKNVPLIPLPSFSQAMGGCERADILGIGFNAVTLDEAVGLAVSALDSGRLMTVVTPNPVISIRCLCDARLMHAVRSASLSLADGHGVTAAAKRRGVFLPERVAGIDFGHSLLCRAAERGDRVFLLGGKPGRAEKAAKELAPAIPGLNVCGTCDGYDGVSGNACAERAIAEARPGIVFVCLGSPRQELWIYEHRDFLEQCGVRVAAALGGSIDVWSGDVRRAPQIFIRLHLEWLWRCVREPRRLAVIPTLVRYRMLTRKRRQTAKQSGTE